MIMHELGFRKYGLPPLSSQFGTHLGGSPPISRSFSFFRRARASSTPWDQLANSCSWTMWSRNSNRSSEIVTFRDFLLRFVTTIYNTVTHTSLNINTILLCSAKINFAEVPTMNATESVKTGTFEKPR